ncbi:hypothetical protein VTL71DRAFT_7696 [Oculimacula yallundae]|uniref:Carboxylesterase type B domain-containing protein n=1 Tax=Oculimacula yallundae TaxID=86028 RepID=A0ABR4BUU5_9HELO
MVKLSSNMVSLALSMQAVFATAVVQATSRPVAETLNGSYYGVHTEPLNQDLFVGIPYAEPPVKELRFANPRSLNMTWRGALPATNYAPECVGYGPVQQGYQQNEDCLYLNIVRPSGYENETLPVLVWIHGGGFSQGGASDLRYNLSFIVNNSVNIGKPIMAASIAYRLGPFGFMNGDDVANEGSTNAGLKDQRLGLHWLKENIAGFGGNPDKITSMFCSSNIPQLGNVTDRVIVWGQSAGAASVGIQLLAFNGRDDKLFRAAIMMSGNPLYYGAQNKTNDYQSKYDGFVKAAGCEDCTNPLACLRRLPYAVMNNILNTTSFNSGWNPAIDGDFIARYSSDQMADGSFVHVPIISGANSDEGTSFSPTPVNSEAAFTSFLNVTSSSQIAWPADVLSSLERLYMEEEEYQIPSAAALGGNVTIGPPYGPFWRRSAAYFGDYTFIAGRRLTCQTWASAGLPAYCYRFNAIPSSLSWPLQATHFAENAFVFANLEGVGYKAIKPFANRTQSYFDLSYLMSSTLASFTNDLNPNGWKGRDTEVGSWPMYDAKMPRNLVFDANVTSYIELDTFRAEGIRLLNEHNYLQRR